MLVLSRKKGECIVIGDDIVITVVKIHGDKVRLGIEAPREIPVNRQEVAYDDVIHQGRKRKRKEEERKQQEAEEHDTPDAPETEPDPRSFLTMAILEVEKSSAVRPAW